MISQILIAVFLTAYLIRLLYVMDMYLHDWWAVEYSIREFKNCHYLWLSRGVRKFMMRDYPGALLDFNEAYHHKPYDLKVLYNCAVASFMVGDCVKAREFLESAKKNIYDELEMEVQPAFESLEKLMKQVEEAKAKGEKAVNIDLRTLMVVK